MPTIFDLIEQCAKVRDHDRATVVERHEAWEKKQKEMADHLIYVKSNRKLILERKRSILWLVNKIRANHDILLAYPDKVDDPKNEGKLIQPEPIEYKMLALIETDVGWYLKASCDDEIGIITFWDTSLSPCPRKGTYKCEKWELFDEFHYMYAMLVIEQVVQL